MSVSEQGVENTMRKYGVSREMAIALLEKQFASMPGRVDSGVETVKGRYDPEVGRWFSTDGESDVTNPESSMIKEETTKTLEDGTVYKSSVSSPGMTPNALAKKALEEQQSAEESNPQASQFDESLLNEYGLGFFGSDQDIGMLDPEGWGAYDDTDRYDSAVATGTMDNALQDHQGTLGLWDGALSEPLSETEELINSITGAGIAPAKEYAEPKISTTQDAENIINDEAPEIIPWINEFEQAVKEFDENEALVAAERITDKAIETGLDKVKPRAFKALTVALTSMLFGVDAVDAIESGAEVVAQDYAEEAAASAAASSTIADQLKFEREETFKAGLDIQKERAKAGLTSSSEMTKDNYSALKDMVSHFEGINPDLKETLGMTDLMGPLQEAHAELTRTYGELNLKDSAVGSAYRKGVQGFLKEIKFNPGTTETMLSFMKDQIARKELTDYKGSITSEDLKGKHSRESKESREMISNIFTKIQALAAKVDPATNSPIGEKGAMLAFKEAFKEHNATERGSSDQAEAKAAGVTPFIWFAANFNG